MKMELTYLRKVVSSYSFVSLSSTYLLLALFWSLLFKLFSLYIIYSCSQHTHSFISVLINKVLFSLNNNFIFTRCWDLSSCILTTVPVGRWVMRTALSVVFTCWPPALLLSHDSHVIINDNVPTCFKCVYFKITWFDVHINLL